MSLLIEHWRSHTAKRGYPRRGREETEFRLSNRQYGNRGKRWDNSNHLKVGKKKIELIGENVYVQGPQNKTNGTGQGKGNLSTSNLAPGRPAEKSTRR